MKNEFISVVIPVFNGEKDIEACLGALEGQDYPKNKYEVIVVDNNSRDNSVSLIKKHPVGLLFEKRQSAAAARNTGVKNAKGNIIAFLDHDCLASKNWLAEVNKNFQDESVQAVQGRVLSVAENSVGMAIQAIAKEKAEIKRLAKDLGFRIPGFCVTANFAIRKKAFDLVKGFGNFFEGCGGEDSHLGFKLRKKGIQIKYCNSMLIKHIELTSLKTLIKKRQNWGYWSYVWRAKEKAVHERWPFLNRYVFRADWREEKARLYFFKPVFNLALFKMYLYMKLFSMLKLKRFYQWFFPLFSRLAHGLGVIKAAEQALARERKGTLSYLKKSK